MQEYFNKCCGECGEKFTENDNIAVCPDCGTPIHKSCWKGHCPNEAKHAEGFDWNRTEVTETYKKIANAAATEKTVCALCNEPVVDDMVRCPDCGTVMHKECYKEEGGCPNEDSHLKHVSWSGMLNNDGFENGEVFRIQSFSDIVENLKNKPVVDRSTGEELTCHGVKQKELIYFLGENYLSTPRYLMLFLRMANSKKRVSLNIFAGLLMPYYQFYQRMIGPAIILLILNFIISIPSSLYQINIMMNSASENVMNMSGFGNVITILSIVGVAIQIAAALFHDYIYMRWSVNKILNLREKHKDCSAEEYYEALKKAGPPKWKYTLIGIGISFLISGIFTFLYF